VKLVLSVCLFLVFVVFNIFKFFRFLCAFAVGRDAVSCLLLLPAAAML